MRYWWVNQNQTFRQEIDGGYLSFPKRNANGARVSVPFDRDTFAWWASENRKAPQIDWLRNRNSSPPLTPAAQIKSLTNVPRLLAEGLFTATYKYALLSTLADLVLNSATTQVIPSSFRRS